MKHNKNSPKENRKPINVILDLDNTVIYSIPCEKLPKNENNHHHSMTFHKMDDDYYVFERPGLQDFLDWLYDNYNISVWSAASPDYVEFIVKNVIEKNGRKIDFVLNSDNCEQCQEIFGDKHIKNLKMLWNIHDLYGFGPLNTLIIDDLKMVCKVQPNNSIQIKSFNTNTKMSIKDDELKKIKKRLKKISSHFDKNIDKQGYKFKLVKE
jgi:TFIIF-interacting CTD phosphatase-like protein